jgi:phosphoenolpyruvate synthase/pyruvate phosphate dikinase
MEFIRDFQNLDKEDVAIAGGKGASLGELTGAGFLVPPGFVILSNVFEKFLADSDLSIEIDDILRNVDCKKIRAVKNASKKIQTRILGAEVPRKISDEIHESFKRLGSNFVAVRSSATAEDGLEAAWAGQLESYLNISDKNLSENVKKCWASLFSSRAIFYRLNKKLNNKKISVAVVVQKMIKSDISGIAFSVHPVTRDKNQIIIDAVFGLGEAIVSGQITPDSYIADKNKGIIINKDINKQEKAVFRSSSEGNEWEKIPMEKQAQQKLSDREILKLSRLIKKIEKHYGFPVDVEWAKEKNRFHIIQSRPITTLRMKPRREFEKIYNRSLPLFAVQYWQMGELHELPKISDDSIFYNPLFIYRNGKEVDVYYDVTDYSEDERPIPAYFTKHPDKFRKIAGEYQKICREMLKLARSAGPKDFSKIFRLHLAFWPRLAVMVSLGERFGKDKTNPIFREALRLRKKTDKVDYISSNNLFGLAEKLVPEQKEFIEFMTFEEIAGKNTPSLSELKKRKKGYIFYDGKIYPDLSIKDFRKKENIAFYTDGHPIPRHILGGITAMKGKVVGRARIVLNLKSLEKVENNEVLIASMTTPDFLMAMEKAVAFVTDEGGITCHAAISAREMGKPCLIATKIATSVIRNGDLIEVDANLGVVRILQRAV